MTLAKSINILYFLKMSSKENRLVEALGKVNGVITLGEIRSLFPEMRQITLLKWLKKLVESEVLIKVKAGLYASPSAEMRHISFKLDPGSYLSMDTVLSRLGLMGSIPGRHLKAIRVGSPRRYSFKMGLIEHLSMSPAYYGHFRMAEGALEAIPEKAFVDSCYYRFKGRHLNFNPESDVDLGALSMDLLMDCLAPHQGPFQNHVHQLLEGKDG